MEACRGAEALEDLFQRCRAGDTTAFAGVYQRFSRPLYATALRMLRRPEDAEDALQETFLTLHRKMADLEPARTAAWLKRVLVNCCIDRVRRRQSHRETELMEPPDTGPGRQDGLHLDLQRAVARLPRRARMVFLLHDVEGFGHREVAELLGVTEGASKSQLFRARGLLRGFLTPAPGGAS